MMKNALVLLVFVLILSVVGFGQSSSQAAGVVKKDLSQAEIDKIIKTFTKNEGLFRRALNEYAFDRSATVQTIGMGGQVSGVFRRDSYMTFNDAGERFEKINFAPISTLTEIGISVADIENLGGIDPFAIEPKVADQYAFTYIGVEHIDDFDLYVFDVGPKTVPDAKKGVAKFFQGRIWVDVGDLMIIQTKGKAVPEGKERFPIVTTIRGSVDNKYYFPIYSSSNGADGTLVFPSGQVVKTTFKVTYKNYRMGRSDVRILDDDEPVKPSPSLAPQKK
jgi:hypothetical protein